jgi:hypothetical protein
MSFPASVQFPDAVTLSGAVPELGVTLRVQLGVVSITVTVCGGDEPPAPFESTAERTMLKVPALV